MSRRVGVLSVAILVAGGVLAWLMQATSLTAQVPGVNPVIVQEVPAKAVPAPPVHRAEGVFDFHAMNENEQKIQKALGDPTDLEFIDTPLKDAMDFLANSHNITVIIDEPALTEEGIAMDEPINRTLSGIKLESALKIILEPLGLTQMTENEVLKITSISAANARRSMRVYNTGYLKQIGVEPEALRKTIQATIQPEEWRQNAASTGLASAPERQSVVAAGQDGGVRLWDVQTGKSSFRFNAAKTHTVQAGASSPFPVVSNSMEVLGDMLVVSAPNSVHDEIRNLLMQLDRRWETEQGGK